MQLLAHVGGVPVEELFPQAVTFAVFLAPLAAVGIARMSATLRRRRRGE